VYGTTPANWRPDASAELQATVDRWAVPAQTQTPEGWATIETYTVKHRRNGTNTAVIIGRLEDDRFLARSDDDPSMLALLADGEPIGQRIYVRSLEAGSRVTVTPARMDELFGPTPSARSASEPQPG
jgi:acetyl-CoA C-acetyltransferase